MNNNYYTVNQISDMLNIHPKTIQRYIREGKLYATKIGKSWRIHGHDLSAFIESERDVVVHSENHSEPSVIASSVIDISVNSRDEAVRIMNTLTAALNNKPPEYGQSSMQSQYVEYEKMIRVTLWGNLRFMTVMLGIINSLTEQNQNEE